jgi:hypothetical protein
VTGQRDKRQFAAGLGMGHALQPLRRHLADASARSPASAHQ